MPPLPTPRSPAQPSVRVFAAIDPVTFVSLVMPVGTLVPESCPRTEPMTAPVPPETERLLPTVRLPVGIGAW